MSLRTPTTLLAVLVCCLAPSAAFAQDEAPGGVTDVASALEELANGTLPDTPESEDADLSGCELSLRSSDDDEAPAGDDEVDPVELCLGEEDEDDGTDAADDEVVVEAPKAVTKAKLLKVRWLDGGAVTVPAAGKVTQQLRYKGAVVGSTTKSVSKPGTVRLKVRLSSAGRKALRSAGARPRLSVRTTLTPRKGAATSATRSIVLR